MSRIVSARFVRLLATALVLSGVHVQAQCSMCRSLLATPEGQQVAAALRAGIWILLAAPFSVFAVIAYAAVKRKTQLDAALSREIVGEPSRSLIRPQQ